MRTMGEAKPRWANREPGEGIFNPKCNESAWDKPVTADIPRQGDHELQLGCGRVPRKRRVANAKAIRSDRGEWWPSIAACSRELRVDKDVLKRYLRNGFPLCGRHFYPAAREEQIA